MLIGLIQSLSLPQYIVLIYKQPIKLCSLGWVQFTPTPGKCQGPKAGCSGRQG